MPAPVRPIEDNYDNISAQLNDDESVADDMTVASVSFMGEDDRYDMSQQSTGHRKRKRDEPPPPQNVIEQAHMIYSDDLLDYFMLSHDSDNAVMPEPPLNFRPDWTIDTDGHTAMHWAAAMGDVDVMKQLRRFGANLEAQNIRGETPLMRAVLFTNCLDKQTMPAVVKELIETIDAVDHCHATALHHAAMMTAIKPKHQCARYYLDIIINKMQEMLAPEQVQRILDAQDSRGDTAAHIAARYKARKCVRALIGRGASTSIPNQDGVTAEELIQDLNESRKVERLPQASSSPFGPDSGRHMSHLDHTSNDVSHRGVSHYSEAAMSVTQKITPAMVEKFRDLANSFDDELQDKDNSEKDSHRILNGVHIELSTVREQIINLEMSEIDNENEAERSAKLNQIQNIVTALIEQQQQLQLLSRSHREENQANGHSSSHEDDISERLVLARKMNEEQTKRQELVARYRDALSVAGVSEEGEVYKNLISKCTGTEMEVIDENLDSLIEQLEEDQTGREGEVLVGEEL